MAKKWSEIDSISDATDTHEFVVIKAGFSKRISKLNFLKELVAKDTAQDSTISGLSSSISANANNISQNTNNITSNTNNIDLLATESVSQDDRLSVLENKDGFYYAESGALTITSQIPIFDIVNSLSVLSLPIGTYKVEIPMLYSFTSTADTAFFRFRINAGAWTEIRKEPKDATDKSGAFYSFIYKTIVISDFLLEVEGAKEDGSGVLEVYQQTTMLTKMI